MTDMDTKELRNVPIFLKKLWKMVNDPSTSHIIEWNLNGDGFVIHEQFKFMVEYLPKYFKHNNLASFIRQLNMYNFHKVPGEQMEFVHDYFIKDEPLLLALITRKPVLSKSKALDVVGPAELQRIMSNVRDIRVKHKQVEDHLHSLKQENSALWREVSNLRIKYVKQSKMINKLVHFLVTYVQPSESSLRHNRKRVKDGNVAKVPTTANNGPTIFELDSNGSPAEFWRKFDESNSSITEPGSSNDCAITFNPTVNLEDDPLGTNEPSVKFKLNKNNELIRIKQEAENVDDVDLGACSTIALTGNETQGNVTKNNLEMMMDGTQEELDSIEDILRLLTNNPGSVYNLYGNENDKSDTEKPTEYMVTEEDSDTPATALNEPSLGDFDLGTVMPEIDEYLNENDINME